MDAKQKKNVDIFLDEIQDNEKSNKKEIINQKDGLIERIDKKYVTEDGKMLLRERYF